VVQRRVTGTGHAVGVDAGSFLPSPARPVVTLRAR
jgi:hypothetical protein